jgi:uncharacterized protein (DUF2267 family)
MDEITVIHASHEDWAGLVRRAAEPDGHEARVVLEVHQRLLAVEARLPWVGTAPTTAPLPRLDRDAVAAGWRKIREERESATADGLSPVEPAPQAPQGVTVNELADAIARVCTEKKPGNDLRALYDITVALWSDPRIGPLLRGEGATVQSPVVLPEEPPALATDPTWIFDHDFRYMHGRRDAWAAARAEVARQQGGQADG